MFVTTPSGPAVSLRQILKPKRLCLYVQAHLVEFINPSIARSRSNKLGLSRTSVEKSHLPHADRQALCPEHSYIITTQMSWSNLTLREQPKQVDMGLRLIMCVALLTGLTTTPMSDKSRRRAVRRATWHSPSTAAFRRLLGREQGGG
jgi:hypothetical protein